MPTYLNIPDVEGNASSSTYSGWLTVESFHMQTMRNIVTYPGQSYDRDTGLPMLSELSITKLIDKASPLLMQAALENKTYSLVKMHVCRSGSSNITAYQEWEFKNVMISQYEIQQDEDGKPFERIMLNFTSVQS